MKQTFLALVMLVSTILPSTVNTWQLHSSTFTGARAEAALTYHADSSRFVITLGYQRPDSLAYSELMYSASVGKWINFFPSPTLYGVWGDSTGNVRGLGKTGNSTFGTPYFVMKNISYGGENYLRPCLAHYRESNAFTQYAVDTDNDVIYYYVNNMTISYSNRTRKFDTIGTTVHPAKIDGSPNNFSLRWGTMCYNPVSRELLLVGGGGVDTRYGNNGCWRFDIASRTWTKHEGLQPEPRAHSAMAYDASAGKIVLYGGDHLDFLYSDTWVYDCASRVWEQRAPAKSPRPRAGHSMQYLTKQQALVMFGGYEYTSCSSFTVCGVYRQLPVGDLWTYNTMQNEWKLVKRFSGDKFPSFHICRSIKGAADADDKILALGEKDSVWQLECDASVTDETGTALYGVEAGTKYYRVGPWNPVYFTEGMTSPDTSTNEAFLRNIPENQWVNVSAPKRPRGNRDWGTSSIDPVNGLIIKHAGGHSAHCGTDVVVYSIPENRWRISHFPEYPLDYVADAASPGIVSFGGNPWTAHAYDRYDYDYTIGKLIHMRNHYTYFFDPRAMKWDSLRIRNHPDMTTSGYYVSHTMTPHGMVVWSARGISSSPSNFDLYLFNTDSMKWSKLSATGRNLIDNYSDRSGAVYDSRRDRLIMLNTSTSTNPVMIAYNFQTGMVSDIIPTNNNTITGVDRFRESVYLPDLDIILYQAEIGGNKVIYDCTANEWKLVNIPKGSGVGGTDSRSSGYMYDAKRGIIWDSETNCQTYALKLTAGHVGRESIAITKSHAVELALFPNPMNPEVSISVSIPAKGTVSIVVYNLSGQKVNTIFQGVSLDAGRYTFSWNGSDNSGKRMATDTYFIRLNYENRTITRKVSLVK